MLMAKTFPFAAIVGQDEMGLALQIVAVDPTVGGVLVLGDRGTGKSTAVRALADLLPSIEVVQACPYGCSPKDTGLACDVCAELKGKGKVKTTNTGRMKRLSKPMTQAAIRALPKPLTVMPVLMTSTTFTPSAAIPISPAAGRYIPDVVSDRNVTPGALTVPLLFWNGTNIPPLPERDRLSSTSAARSLMVPFAHVVVMSVSATTGLVAGRVMLPDASRGIT